MHEVQPNLLWVGHAGCVRDPSVLFAAEIGAVIDLAGAEEPALLPRQMIYCRFPLNDGEGNDGAVLSLVLRTVAGLLDSNIRTLVACSAGRSRSPTIAAFGLAMHLQQRPETVLERLAERRSLEVSPLFWNATAEVYEHLLRGS